MKQPHSFIATVVASMTAVVTGASIRVCPNSVCYSVAVPSSSANTGSGNIYFQITSPVTNSWVALGTGSRMAGSNIFLVYQDGSGNVTVSPRTARGHMMPTLDTSSQAAKLTVLAGSGLSADGSTMVANIRCSNCQSWNGGSMSLSGVQTNWIGAWKSRSSLDTTNTAASIQQHDDTIAFSLDLTQAVVASDSNPFVAGTGTGAGTGTSGGGGGGNSTGGGGTSSSGGFTLIAGPNQKILYAHGIIMAVLFVILYPLGSMLMPLLGKWKVHAAIQIFNFSLMWAGFGLGIQAAKERDMFGITHTTLGIVVVALLFFQPMLGFAHHRHYVKYQRRGAVSYVHIGWGQSLMILGIVNGGLGLQIAGAGDSLIVAYAVVAAVIFVTYGVVKMFTLFRARRRASGGSPGDQAKRTETPSPPSGVRRPYP